MKLIFAGIIVIAVFLHGLTPVGRIEKAEASFLDTIMGLVAINPLRVSTFAPAEVDLVRNFKAEATIENRGARSLGDVKAEIFIPEGLVLVSKKSVQEAGRISGHKTRKVIWQLKGVLAGNFGISAVVSGEVEGDFVSAQSNTAVVAIKEVSVKKASAPPESLFDFWKRLLKILQEWF